MDPPASTAALSSRSRLPGAMEVQSILSRDHNEQIAPSPPEHIGGNPLSPKIGLARSNSTSSRWSLGLSTNTTDLGRRNSKRLAVAIPIQPSNSNAPPQRAPSPTKSAGPTSIPESLASPTGPTDSNLLTALAAQERRVLELKEELQKAEQELRKLKHEWAAHEAQKKRHDARKVQKLRPLSVGLPSAGHGEEDTDGGSAWMQQEMERRKALLSGTKTSSRTIFSGSRHARTLSLMPTESAPTSPVKARPEESLLAPPEVYAGRPSTESRTSSNGDLTEEAARDDIQIDLGIPREVLLKTGRQMASDFKDGLWTFIEDLRQATVGEEAINGWQAHGQYNSKAAPGRRGSARGQPSTASVRAQTRQQAASRQAANASSKRVPARSPSAPAPDSNSSDLIDVGGAFWKENGLEEIKTAAHPIVRQSSKNSLQRSTAPRKGKHVSTPSLEAWDNWSSPPAEKAKARSNSDSSVSEAHSSQSITSSPRTSVSDGVQAFSASRPQRDAIPWPALNKLSPGNLRRTASHLMNEWEKSLSPPPDAHQGETAYKND